MTKTKNWKPVTAGIFIEAPTEKTAVGLLSAVKGIFQEGAKFRMSDAVIMRAIEVTSKELAVNAAVTGCTITVAPEKKP